MSDGHKIYIECHQGLGDHLICSGLYRRIADRSSSVVIPVRAVYKSEVETLLFNVPQAKIITFPDFYFKEMTIANGLILAQQGYEVLKLGHFGRKYLELADRFDEAFYVQAGVNFSERWTAFEYRRNKRKEEQIFSSLVSTKKRYAFLHDDADRGFRIDEDFVSPNLEIIRPIKRNTSVFDYRMVLERADEIHCIESSFSILIDNLDVSNARKFIHRYSRPEATQDTKHEASYRSNWHVLAGTPD